MVWGQAQSNFAGVATNAANMGEIKQKLAEAALAAGDGEAPPTPSQSPADEEPSSSRMRFDLFDASTAADGLAPRTRGAKHTIAPKGAGNPAPKRSRNSAAPSQVEESQSHDPKGGAPASGGAPVLVQNKKVIETMREARELFSKHSDTFADAAIWNNKTRKRTLDAATKALSTHAGSLLATNDEEAALLSQEITAWCDKVELRFDALSGVRSSPLDFVGDVTGDGLAQKLETLQNMSVPILSTVILSVAGDCLKLLDKAAPTVTVAFTTLPPCSCH